jgi:Uma2 family endonuclease
MGNPEIAAALSGLPPAPGDQVIVLRGIPFEQYEALCDAREKATVRMAYLDGDLEIMSPSRSHEAWKTLLARLIEAYAEERGLRLAGFGSETYRKETKQAGLEADESYCVGEEKPFPDLALEVVLTSGGVDRLEIYRRLGVPEVWYLSRKGITVFRLAERRYEVRTRSTLFPELDLQDLWRITTETPPIEQTEAVRSFRRSLRRRRRRR